MPRRSLGLRMSMIKPLTSMAAFIGMAAFYSVPLSAQVTDDAAQQNTLQEETSQDDIAQATETLPKQRPNIIGDIVTLRTLDKVTAITKDYDVKIGESLKFASLTIDVKHCEVKPPEAIPETFAFLQIFEPPQLRAKEREELKIEPETIKLFSGWMLASKPAISALDHPVYDVWVIGCKGGAIEG